MREPTKASPPVPCAPLLLDASPHGRARRQVVHENVISDIGIAVHQIGGTRIKRHLAAIAADAGSHRNCEK